MINSKIHKANSFNSNPNNSNKNIKTKTNIFNQMNSSSSLTIVNTEPLKILHKVDIEKDIIKQIEEFRYKLNEELLTMLTDEKQKEENRERLLISCQDKRERNKLENLFGIERAQAANKINLYSE